MVFCSLVVLFTFHFDFFSDGEENFFCHFFSLYFGFFTQECVLSLTKKPTLKKKIFLEAMLLLTDSLFAQTSKNKT
jgi:hypothetical protein